jgi:hypothetical protein
MIITTVHVNTRLCCLFRHLLLYLVVLLVVAQLIALLEIDLPHI